MKDDPQPPPPIDPRLVADEQIRINRAQMQDNARFNRVDQSNPWGSIQWTRDAEGNPISMNMNLNPQDQARLDVLRQQMAQRAGMGQQYLNQVDTRPLDFSGLHPIYDRYSSDPSHQYAGAVNARQNTQGPPQPGPGQDYQAINPLMRNGGIPDMPASGAMAIAQALRNAPAGSTSGGSMGGTPLASIEGLTQQADAEGSANIAPIGGGSGGNLPYPGMQPSSQEGMGTLTDDERKAAPDFQLTYQDYLARGADVGTRGTDGAAPAMSEAQWNALTPEQQWANMGGGMMVHNSDPRYDAMARGIGETDRDRYMMAGPTNDWNSDWMIDPNLVRRGSNGVSYSTSGNESAANQAANDFGMVQYGWALPLGAAAAGAMMGGGAASAAPAAEAANPFAGAVAGGSQSAGAAGSGAIDAALGSNIPLQGAGAQTALNAAPAIAGPSSGFSAMLRNPQFLRAAVGLLMSGAGGTRRSTGSSGTRR